MGTTSGMRVPEPFKPGGDEYTITVQFVRSHAEDDEVCEETGLNHVRQFIEELQEGYDLAAIAGSFQVVAYYNCNGPNLVKGDS